MSTGVAKPIGSTTPVKELLLNSHDLSHAIDHVKADLTDLCRFGAALVNAATRDRDTSGDHASGCVVWIARESAAVVE